MNYRRLVVAGLQALELKVEVALASAIAALTLYASSILLLRVRVTLHSLLARMRHILLRVEAQAILAVCLGAGSHILRCYKLAPDVWMIARVAALLFPLLPQLLDFFVELEARVLVRQLIYDILLLFLLGGDELDTLLLVLTLHSWLGQTRITAEDRLRVSTEQALVDAAQPHLLVFVEQACPLRRTKVRIIADKLLVEHHILLVENNLKDMIVCSTGTIILFRHLRIRLSRRVSFARERVRDLDLLKMDVTALVL